MTIKVEREALLQVLERPPKVSPLQESCYCIEECYNDNDDCSVSTSSTLSFSDISEDDVVVRTRVSFADELVSQVVTRPRTPLQDISQLYYSTEEISSFRQDYRLERKLLSELSLDYSTIDAEQLEGLTADSSSASSKHLISRVVVLHNDKLETFFTTPQPTNPCHLENAFFDNDSFWSGSITWY